MSGPADTKHTPGPWSVSQVPGIVDVRAPTGGFVANVDCDKRLSLAEIDANAKLIAAAPELAEALRAITETQWVGSSLTAADIQLACQRMTMLARSALAKAGL